MKRTAAVCLVFVLALVLMTPGNAFWSEALNLNMDVGTGDVLVGMRSHGDFYGADPDGRDTAYISCRDGRGAGELDGVVYSENIEVDIYGYRSYAPVCALEIANCGSIPVKLDRIRIDWSGELSVQVKEWTLDYPGGYRDEGKGYRSLNRALRGASLDPGQKIWLDLAFRVNSLESSKQTAYRVFQKALLASVRVNSAEAAGESAEGTEADTPDAGAGADTSSAEPLAGSASETGSADSAPDKDSTPAAGDAGAGLDPVNSSRVAGSELDPPADSEPDAGAVSPGDSTSSRDPGTEAETEQPAPAADLDQPDSDSSEVPASSQTGNPETSQPAAAEPAVDQAAPSGGGAGGEPEIEYGFASATITIDYYQWNAFK